MKVYFLGPKSSFSNEAAKRFFLDEELVPVESIKKVFQSTEKAPSDAGVIPLENSIEGSVTATLDILAQTNLLIAAELFLDINQCILSNEKSFSSIKRIYSHPQGFAQCREFLEQNIPAAELIASSSTARAAEKAAKEMGSGAIASEAAGKEFSLNILQKSIQDSKTNKTRFAVIAKSKTAKELFKRFTGEKPKTSLLFGTKHEPGALFSALEAFKRHGVNMSKIESRPSRKKDWEYVFFVDIEGAIGEKNIDSALNELKEHCEFLKVLGSYYKFE